MSETITKVASAAVPFDILAALERYHRAVLKMRPACHRNPHAFAEDKSEVLALIATDMKRHRTIKVAAPVALPPIRPGTRTIGGRDIRIENRRRAA